MFSEDGLMARGRRDYLAAAFFSATVFPLMEMGRGRSRFRPRIYSAKALASLFGTICWPAGMLSLAGIGSASPRGVDSMATEGKKSRNAMLNLLVEVGIDEVREKLDQDVAERLTIGEARALQVLMREELESISE